MGLPERSLMYATSNPAWTTASWPNTLAMRKYYIQGHIGNHPAGEENALNTAFNENRTQPLTADNVQSMLGRVVSGKAKAPYDMDVSLEIGKQGITALGEFAAANQSSRNPL